MYKKKLNHHITISLDDIDHQHLVILGFIDKIKNARYEDSKLKSLIIEVNEHVASHFRMEEELLEKAGYEFVRAHKKVHELINKRLLEIFQRFEIGENVADEIINLLQNWFNNHIQNDDSAYIPTITAYLSTENPTPSGSQWWTQLTNILLSIFKIKY